MTGILSYGQTFPFYIKEFLDDIDSETADRYDLLTNKNVSIYFIDIIVCWSVETYPVCLLDPRK